MCSLSGMLETFIKVIRKETSVTYSDIVSLSCHLYTSKMAKSNVLKKAD